MGNYITRGTIETMAAEAILEFNQKHNTACILSIENGTVIATPLADAPKHYDDSLVITPYTQNVGLTIARWNLVGNKLYKLYTLESA